MRVRYTPRARADLDKIYAYIDAQNPNAARAVKAAIRDTIASLADFPGMGCSTERAAGLFVFPLSRYPYLIFYRVSGAELAIVHVRHAARRPL